MAAHHLIINAQTDGSWKRALLLIAMLSVVAASRLPFLDAGYGSVNDGWRVAVAARKIAVSREYWPSRFPPHPLQEIIDSFLWKAGPRALNGATVLLSVLAVLFFTLSMKVLGHRDYLLAGLGLAFIPLIFINSTNSLDYVWALAFILGALYFVLISKPLAAGALLGLAIGSRITSGAMLIPLCFLLVQRARENRATKLILKFALATVAVGAATFVPAFLKYGLSFLTFSEDQHPTAIEVLRYATLDVWGSIGCVALLFAFGASIVRKGPPDAIHWKELSIWIVAIALYAVAFLRLPYQPGYLVPIVPFVILLVAGVLRRPLFALFCGAMVLSSFISITRSGLHEGPIFADYRNRVEGVQSVERVLTLTSVLPPKSVVVSGHWLPRIEVYVPPETQHDVKYVFLMDRNQLTHFLDQGYTVFCLPGQREYNLQRYNLDLFAEGAQSLSPEFRRPAAALPP